MKKLISVFLVVVVLSCVFVCPVSAAEVEPYGIIIECPECGGLLRFGRTVTLTEEVFVLNCENSEYPHFHDLIIETTDVHCSECSYTSKYTTSEEVCP